jgi:hypothetical protein
MAAMSINRTYGNIAGFWVITRKPLIKILAQWFQRRRFLKKFTDG